MIGLKWFKLDRSTIYWIEMLLSIFFLLGILVFVEMLSFEYNYRVDLTPNKKYSFSNKTVQILKSIKKPIEFTVFYKKGKREEYEHLFKLLSYYSPKIKYKLYNLDRHPGIAKLYEASYYGQTIVETNGRKLVINSPKKKAIFDAILELTNSKWGKKILFTVGHGESVPRIHCKKLKEILEIRGINIDTVHSLIIEKIPEDTSVVIVAGPERDFLPEEVEILNQYIENGGSVLFMVEPFILLPNIQNLLRKFQVSLNKGIIVDKTKKLINRDNLTPIIPYFARGPITKNLRSVLLFSTARNIDIEKNEGSNIYTQFLAMSSKSSWSLSEKDVVKQRKYNLNKKDYKKGPFIVAVFSKRYNSKYNIKKKGNEIVCIGDSDFIKDQFIGMYSNKEFFMNTINWLAGGEQKKIDFVSKSKYQFPYHYMTEENARWIFWLAVVIVPVLFLFFGGFVLIYRRIYS